MARSNSHENMSVSKDSQITDRRKALRRKEDEEIRRSEERFRTITENSFDGVSIIGADGTILYESPSVKWMLGYEVEDRIGANSFEDIHPDDMLEAANAFQKIVNNPDETATIILRIKHEDGSWRWIECSGRNLINNASVGGIVINYHDITERKQAEEALRESEERFRHIFNGVNDEIVYTDTDGVVLNVNEKIGDMFGYSPAEMIGRNVLELDLFDPDELSKLSELMMASVEQGGARRPLMEVQARHRDGHVVPLEVSTSLITAADGTPKGFVSIIRDITERKQAEEALCQSEEKYRELINTSTDGVISVDTRMNIALWNQGAERIFGYTEEEILGQSLTKIARKKDLVNTRKAVQDRS